MGLGFPAGTTSLNAVALIELHHSTLRLSKGSTEFDGDADTAAQPGIGAARAEPNDVPASDESEQRCQAAGALPLAHKSSHLRTDQLTAVLGVEQQWLAVDDAVDYWRRHGRDPRCP